MHKIEVCFTPQLFSLYENTESIVVVVDVLRATTSICSAFAHGAKAIIPVQTLQEAQQAKENGYIVAAERNGIPLDFADFGNSPSQFTRERVGNKEIVYSTTNGTKTIYLALQSKAVVIGAFSNISVLTEWIATQHAPVVILCAGWKGKYNIEDSAFAGALAQRLLLLPDYYTHCDSAITAIDMWEQHAQNLRPLIEKSAQYSRLKSNNLHDCIDFCLTQDTCNVIPIFSDGKLINLKKNS